jgi:hypothetical protein
MSGYERQMAFKERDVAHHCSGCQADLLGAAPTDAFNCLCSYLGGFLTVLLGLPEDCGDFLNPLVAPPCPRASRAWRDR